MARIVKSGLDYFPFDIDFFQDIRIRKLIKHQGGKAVTVYTLLLCLIYKNGYYMRWDNELPFICSEITGFDEAFIREAIKACLSLGLFNKNLFASERILSSRAIQTRYTEIQRRNKRIATIDSFSLLNETPRDEPPLAAETPSIQPQVPPANHALWIEQFFSDAHSENLRLLCKDFGIVSNGIPVLQSLARDIVAEWELSHVPHSNYSDFSRHLIATMRIKYRNSPSKPSQPSAQSAPDYTFKGGFGGLDT